MDITAITLSVKLAFWTLLFLVPLSIGVGRWLARTTFRGKLWIEALIALPLVLPPTVVGYYLLVSMGSHSPLGRFFEQLLGSTLAFSFEGLVAASILVNIPFAVLPVQRSFESVSRDVREAAQCCGMSTWQTLRRIELPLAWPGILSATVLTFGHTLGEFGVVLMVGGNIPGETRTVSIAIYDRIQAFDQTAAGQMALMLLLLSLVTVGVSYVLAEKWLHRFRSQH